jgi:hypothetical protein
MYYDVCRKVLLLDRTIKAMKLKLCLVFPSKKKLCLVRFNTCNTERYLCPKSQRVLVLHVGCLFFFLQYCNNYDMDFAAGLQYFFNFLQFS